MQFSKQDLGLEDLGEEVAGCCKRIAASLTQTQPLMLHV